MAGHHRALAALSAVVLAASAGASAAQDFEGRRASVFDLGIYGGGAYHSDWFTVPEGQPGDYPDRQFGITVFSFGGDVGARQSEIFLPGVGTVQRGGQEIHILAPGRERVTGAQGRIGFSFKAAEAISPSPASSFYFSYGYFEGAGDRFGSIAPNTDNVAFTLDRFFPFPGGGATTGLFGGTLGMNVRQDYYLHQHRIEFGMNSPFPAGPATFILKTGATLDISNQNSQSLLSLITLPNITMTESRDTDQLLFGPTIGAAFQFPVPIGTGAGGVPSTLFLTVGGEITPMFGQTTFNSAQVINCVVCGPNFPVSTASSASISEPFLEAGAFFRVALTVATRAKVYGEVGVTSTERGAFIAPANPNEQPLRHEIIQMIDNYVRGGIAFGL
jgi:hypothetical protein